MEDWVFNGQNKTVFDGDYQFLKLDIDLIKNINFFIDYEDKTQYFENFSLPKLSSFIDLISEQKHKIEKIEYVFLQELKHFVDNRSKKYKTDFNQIQKLEKNIETIMNEIESEKTRENKFSVYSKLLPKITDSKKLLSVSQSCSILKPSVSFIKKDSNSNVLNVANLKGQFLHKKLEFFKNNHFS